MIDYSSLIDRWDGSILAPWAEVLLQQVEQGLSLERYGDLPRWLEALNSLPDLAPDKVVLDAARVGAMTAAAPSSSSLLQLRQSLARLRPWRKGPFELFGVHIDTEWRSDWKWDRLEKCVGSLTGKRVLDVGCGSGYHCWRMLGQGAEEVIGIDPTPLFVVQFWALQKYLQQQNIWVLPLGIEHVPKKLQAFDTVFSMGILYHRRSPINHLQELRECLLPGGQLVLETLVIKGSLGDTLVPEGRYARMGNVWFIPSCETLMSWMRKLGFLDIQLIDVSVTSTNEQRSTEWMRYHSLADFLDPDDSSKSIEGYPAPRRAIISATVP
ncbi:MAG: tRNA 5-methoxyuridine(34)/uridine 5-oxyacetic acid(34) synthase CmoB [Halieaceae bacterium]|nr:tRNA 5-methoxyuridine(34)/uridine 5-oxyacetic acid(34) synthase CmoB [Halieaceae bacterium]